MQSFAGVKRPRHLFPGQLDHCSAVPVYEQDLHLGKEQLMGAEDSKTEIKTIKEER